MASYKLCTFETFIENLFPMQDVNKLSSPPASHQCINQQGHKLILILPSAMFID